MEYYLHRAFDIARCIPKEVSILHKFENKIKRCLYPFEIDKIFKRSGCREYWKITGNTIDVVKYNNIIRQKLLELGIRSYNEKDISISDIEEAHKFDFKIMEQINKISIIMKNPNQKKDRIRELVKDDESKPSGANFKVI